MRKIILLFILLFPVICHSDSIVFFSDDSKALIERSDLDGSNLQSVFSAFGSIKHITIDQTNNKLVYGIDGKIHFSDKDGTNVNAVVKSASVHGIAVDPASSKIYWSDTNAAAIMRADYDGTNITTLINSGLTSPAGVAVDVANNKIYVVDFSNDKVFRANLNDGSGFVEILDVSGLSGNISDIELDLTAGKLYTGDSFSGPITEANLDGTNPITAVNTKAFGIGLDLTNDFIYFTANDVAGGNGFLLNRADLDLVNPPVENLLSNLNSAPDVELDVANNTLYLIDQINHDIFSAQLNGSNLQSIKTYSFDASNIPSIGVDLVNQKIYWSDDFASTKGIFRSNFDGTNPEIVFGGITTKGIFVDSDNAKLYWTDDANNKIVRSNLNGTSQEDVITTTESPGLSEPLEVFVDTTNSKIYWTDQTTDKLSRANLDGTNVEDLFDETGAYNPTDLSVDTVNGKVYWGTFSATGPLERSNLDGTNREVIIPNLGSLGGVSVDPTGSKVYWTNRTNKKVQRANLDGTNVEDLVDLGHGSLKGIFVVNNDACPGDPNKLLPGQCGCGTPDTDADGDGTAACNEQCDNDANKLVPGVCGCGVADIDTDNDSTLDCNEQCDNDANKLAPGICGCGTADTDSDADGTANCLDQCPNDALFTVAPCEYSCSQSDISTNLSDINSNLSKLRKQAKKANNFFKKLTGSAKAAKKNNKKINNLYNTSIDILDALPSNFLVCTDTRCTATSFVENYNSVKTNANKLRKQATKNASKALRASTDSKQQKKIKKIRKNAKNLKSEIDQQLEEAPESNSSCPE